VDAAPARRHSDLMTEGLQPATTAARPLSRPGQYWHVHECRWVRYAEAPPERVVVPEQAAAAENDAPAVGTAQ